MLTKAEEAEIHARVSKHEKLVRDWMQRGLTRRTAQVLVNEGLKDAEEIRGKLLELPRAPYCGPVMLDEIRRWLDLQSGPLCGFTNAELIQELERRLDRRLN